MSESIANAFNTLITELKAENIDLKREVELLRSSQPCRLLDYYASKVAHLERKLEQHRAYERNNLVKGETHDEQQ